MTSDKRTVSRPLRADAVRNRAAILDAAEALLATEGRALSTEDVAGRAGVGIGTVFRHFPTKEALLEAVLVTRLERLTEEANALAIDDQGEALFLFFERMVQQAARKRALIHALSVLGVDVAKLLREAGAEFRAAIGRLLERAQKQRVVRDDVDVRDVLDLLLALAHAADQGAWKAGTQRRALMVVLDGLRHKRRR